jgi:spore germination cell wall hydrolase CwlJ-like protein
VSPFAEKDTKALLFSKLTVRADARALIGAALVGAGGGGLLAASYLAGAAVRTAGVQAHAVSVASAAPNGFSEAALQAEARSMAPGALAVARRHDPYTAAGAAQRDLQTTLMTASLEHPQSAPSRNGAPAPLLRTSLSHPATQTRPVHLPIDNALAGTRELGCLTDAVYYEARGESSKGQQAVAQVVLNRMRRPGYPKTICGVVYQGAHDQACQFSFACDGSARAPKEMAAWKRAQGVAARALGGFVLSEIGDATHFHVASLGAIWGSGLVRVAQIGQHTFYRLTGRQVPSSRTEPNTYAPPSELADKPIYVEARTKAPTADGADSKLILAAAVSPVLAAGSPLKAAAEPAPAPAPPAADKPVVTEPAAAQAKGAS